MTQTIDQFLTAFYGEHPSLFRVYADAMDAMHKAVEAINAGATHEDPVLGAFDSAWQRMLDSLAAVTRDNPDRRKELVHVLGDTAAERSRIQVLLAAADERARQTAEGQDE